MKDEAEYFITQADSNFLPQLLTMYSSLIRHMSEIELHVLCLDDVSEEFIRRHGPKRMVGHPLSSVITRPLDMARTSRTRKEFYWTLTPFLPGIVFRSVPEASRVTYVDADLWFMSSPELIIDEFERSTSAVLVTPHAYAPEEDRTESHGKFCVQFMTFNRTSSNHIVQWWKDRCIEWCYDRVEDGKFGDQKYLDQWPDLFGSQIHILQHPEWTLAPWNMHRFAYSDAIFYHFHGLRIVNRKKVEIGDTPLPLPVREWVYRPYLAALSETLDSLTQLGLAVPRQVSRRNPYDWLRYSLRPIRTALKRSRRSLPIE